MHIENRILKEDETFFVSKGSRTILVAVRDLVYHKMAILELCGVNFEYLS
jgi:hypothetical protein